MVDQVLRLSFVMIARGIVWIRPAVPTVCFLFLWSTVALTVWSFFKNIRSGVANIKRMHQIPCTKCAYANNSHYLKCSVQPSIAFSEAAIDCQDFECKPCVYTQQSRPADLAHSAYRA